jgi:hypothetical protein
MPKESGSNTPSVKTSSAPASPSEVKLFGKDEYEVFDIKSTVDVENDKEMRNRVRKTAKTKVGSRLFRVTMILLIPLLFFSANHFLSVMTPPKQI